MSFNIDWSKLDSKVSKQLTEKINNFFESLQTKPSVIGDLRVINLDLGTKPPEVELLDITEPFPEFYMPTKEEIEAMEDMELELEIRNAEAELTRSKSVVNQLEGSLQNRNSLYYNHFYDKNPSTEDSYNRKGASVQSLSPSSMSHYPRQNSTSKSENFGFDNSRTKPSFPRDTPNFHKKLFLNQQLEMNMPQIGIRAFPSIKPQSLFSRKDSSHSKNDSASSSKYDLERMYQPDSYVDIYGCNQPMPGELPHSYIEMHNISSDSNSNNRSHEHDKRQHGDRLYSDFDVSAAENFSRTEDSYQLKKSEDDMQLYFKLAYTGDISITLMAELQLNYPASSFMALPITCYVTNLKFSSIFVLAYLADKINICFLEPEPPRTSLLDDLTIRSEIGDGHQHVLKNVETVEKFIVEQLRKSIDENFVFPSYTSIEFSG